MVNVSRSNNTISDRSPSLMMLNRNRMRAFVCFLCIIVGMSIGTRRASNLLMWSSSPWSSMIETSANRPRLGSIRNQQTLRSHYTVGTTEDQEDASSGPDIAIYYNVYIPSNNKEGSEWAYSIIKEQMTQIAQSDAASDRNKITIYYVTIGEEIYQKFMEGLCTFYHFKCVHVSHHVSGYGMITQQAMLDFCKEEENEHTIVSYIHDNGSRNETGRQARNRRVLTTSALNGDCVHHLSKNQCNVCGANFKSVWGPTYWGNMWSARCDYVKNLLSPFQIYSRNVDAYKTKPQAITAEFFKSKNFAMKYSLGKERFAAEQFATNHPNFIPCSFTKPFTPNAIWSADPPGDFFKDYVIQVEDPLTMEEMKDEMNHLKEWYLLPGILWRYYKLYNEIPSLDSWIWRHYPDGESWKTTIEILGFPQALYSRIESTSILKQKAKYESIDITR